MTNQLGLHRHAATIASSRSADRLAMIDVLTTVSSSTDATLLALPAFPPFDPQADPIIGPRWMKWLTRFERPMTAMAITDPERMRALLLHFTGPDIDYIFDALTVPDVTGTATTYSVARDALTAYFTPKVNTAFEFYASDRLLKRRRKP